MTEENLIDEEIYRCTNCGLVHIFNKGRRPRSLVCNGCAGRLELQYKQYSKNDILKHNKTE